MTRNGWRRKRRNTPAEAARRADYNSPAHRAARAAGQADVDAGRARCWRCGKPIPKGTRWHVGHDDQRRIRGPEHEDCNLRAAARKGARIRNRARRAVTRLTF